MGLLGCFGGVWSGIRPSVYSYQEKYVLFLVSIHASSNTTPNPPKHPKSPKKYVFFFVSIHARSNTIPNTPKNTPKVPKATPPTAAPSW